MNKENKVELFKKEDFQDVIVKRAERDPKYFEKLEKKMKNNHTKTIELLEQHMKENRSERNWSRYMDLGDFQKKIGKTTEAGESFNRAKKLLQKIKKGSRSWVCYQNLGDIEKRLESPSMKAKKYYDEAIKKREDEERSWNKEWRKKHPYQPNLARLYSKSGNLIRAGEFFEGTIKQLERIIKRSERKGVVDTFNWKINADLSETQEESINLQKRIVEKQKSEK